MKADLQATKQDLRPVLTGALLGLLLIPVSLVWSFWASTVIVLIVIACAVPATAAVSAKRK